MMQKDPGPPTLVRGIGPLDLAALVINTVIGAGILGLPGRVYGLVGDWSLLVLAGTAALIAAYALVFAELGSRFDRTGGPYLYVATAYGPFAGFSIGWLLWLSRVLTAATQLNLAIEYAAGLEPLVASGPVRVAAIVAVAAALGGLTLGGVGRSARTSTAFTLLKIALFAAFVAAGAAYADYGRLVPHGAPGAEPLGEAVLLLLFAFFGFESVTIVAGETRDPRRVLPAGILAGLAVIALVYATVLAVTIGVLPDPATPERAVAVAAEAVVGPIGATLATVGALAILLGALTGAFILMPRLLFALAEHGQLPAAAARIHPRWRTPYVAVILSAAAVALLSIFSSFVTALVFATVVRLVTYIACCLALLKLRRNEGASPGFRAPAGALLAIVGIVVAGIVLATSAGRELGMTVLALMLGLPFLWLARRGR